MRPRLTGPVLESADPVGLARFYAQLLGWDDLETEGPRPGFPPGDAWARIRPSDGGSKIEFQWDELYRPPVWPSVAGEQQMMQHLDIGVDDLDVGVAHAVSLGAVVSSHQPQDDVRVLLDPQGHPFCLFELPPEQFDR